MIFVNQTAVWLVHFILGEWINFDNNTAFIKNILKM